LSLIRRVIFLGLASVSLVVLAACGDDDAGPASLTITSDDGKLTLEIPPEALDEDVEITITAVPLEDLPEDLQVVQGAGDGYLLEPSGLEFSEPVAVSLELDRAELEDEPDDGIAAYALVSLTEDGERELLDELVTEATLGEDTVVARGELSHFSWITRTKGSLVVSLEEKPREQAVGATFTAKGSIENGDSTGAITLEKAKGTFLAFGSLSTSGETTFDKDFLDEGESVEGTGTFKCDKPGLGTYTLRATSTSLDLDSERGGTPLTVTVDGVVECVGPTTTPTPTPAPTPTPEESSPSPTSGTASDPDEIYLDDPTDDATDCATGESVVDPAVDIRGVALIKDGESIVVEVVTVQSPETSFLDYSAAIQVSLGRLGALAQIHAGQLDEGLFGSDGGFIPGSEEHVTWTDGGVSFLFPDASSVSKGDPLLIETFHSKTAESTRNCDTLEAVYSCFGRCDD
jgi:hypothetical protein